MKCEVPNCDKLAEFNSPKHWCLYHWNQWYFFLPDQEELDWMHLEELSSEYRQKLLNQLRFILFIYTLWMITTLQTLGAKNHFVIVEHPVLDISYYCFYVFFRAWTVYCETLAVWMFGLSSISSLAFSYLKSFIKC